MKGEGALLDPRVRDYEAIEAGEESIDQFIDRRCRAKAQANSEATLWRLSEERYYRQQ